MDERTSLRILAVCVGFAVVAVSGPAVGGPIDVGSVHDAVPRSYQVSVGRDHVFASARVQVRPADLGEADWSDWDRNGDGTLDDPVARVLGSQLRDRELEYLCIAIDGVVLPLGRMAASRRVDSFVREFAVTKERGCGNCSAASRSGGLLLIPLLLLAGARRRP